ncbi:Ig-like domain-containing protein [Longimicrobium terrae]|uniref:BIG2 domain-containing protein n=1 Tax=Longimicrobium terrae TaxID=1639882 RepID=A0A841GVA4_9BACT|nr:Ig-like domain-containing protein [Longimicrobium terrae]MBB4634808.1 hypothetical protein [Longimicrobium terrae]MBB6069203.1 hypothetical protein [Longimicrobium terrae]NNC31985.1 hypothetical protein [Longimicrobium terrae]
MKLFPALFLACVAASCLPIREGEALCLQERSSEPFVVGDAATLRVGRVDADDFFCADENSRPYRWHSSDAGVASVDGKGRLRARKPGKVWVSVAQDTLRDSVQFLVLPPVARIRIEPRGGRIRVGESAVFRIVATDAAGNPVPDAEVEWFSGGLESSFYGPGERGPWSFARRGATRAVWACRPGRSSLQARTRYLEDRVPLEFLPAAKPGAAADTALENHSC